MKKGYDVCIVGLKCLDYVRRAETPRYLGGIERQLSALGRLLADRGLSVCFITYADEELGIERHDGIDVIKAYRLSDGLPGIRFLFPRFWRPFQAMRRARPKTIIQMGASTETGIASFAARALGAGTRFVFLTASDADCQFRSPVLHARRERVMYRKGLRKADAVIVQTDFQRSVMAEQFGIDAQVQHLPSVVKGAEAASVEKRKTRLAASGETRVLWVGRIVKEKRPDWLLSAAARLPNVIFDVVGEPNAASDYANRIVSEASKLPNVRMHGKLGDDALIAHYQEASALLCTSDVEGFPTTFLEAWAHGLPVVTSFDPDDLVRDNELGTTFQTEDELSAALTACLDESRHWDLSANALRFFAQNYAPEAVLDTVIRLFIGNSPEIDRPERLAVDVAESPRGPGE